MFNRYTKIEKILSSPVNKKIIYSLTFLAVFGIMTLTATESFSKNETEDTNKSLEDSSKPTSDELNAKILSSELLPEQLLQIADTQAFAKYVFVVDKNQRKLLLYERSGASIKLVANYPTDIGKNDGNKTKANDHKTPEGIYFFQTHIKPPEIPFDQYGKMAFTLDYPNIFDQRERKTGNGIWLHSVPDTVPLTRGSRGCVVVRNEVIEKLFNFIQLKETPILIFDKVNFVQASEHLKKRDEIASFLKQWQEAWQSKDVDKYLQFYDSEFKGMGFNYKRWRKYKTGLTGKYNYIKVNFDQPFILIHNNQLIVKTLQKYESDKHQDFGIKVIHALKIDGQYKIVSEDWKEADPKGFEVSQEMSSTKLQQ